MSNAVLEHKVEQLEHEFIGISHKLTVVEEKEKENAQSIKEIYNLMRENQSENNDWMRKIHAKQVENSTKLGFLKALGLATTALITGSGATVATTAASSEKFGAVLQAILKAL